MGTKLIGHAQEIIPAPPSAVWESAASLRWLIGWDQVVVPSPAKVGDEIVFQDERRQFRGRFTTYDAPRLLTWETGDGGGGSLQLQSDAAGTLAIYESDARPHARVERLAVGAVTLVASGKAQKLTDEDADKDLRGLRGLVQHRLAEPAGPNSRPGDRLMAAICGFGDRSTDSDTVPEFDAHRSLILEAGEEVIWQGQGGIVTAAATNVRGLEHFPVLWASEDMGASITLTNCRLIYQVIKVAKGDASWLIVGGVTGAALAAGSAVKAAAQRHSHTIAGQVRHPHVANLIAGNGADYGASHLHRVAATLFDPPETGIRVHVLLNDATAAFATLWPRAVARWRMARYPELENLEPEKWHTLATQAKAPAYTDSPLGRTAWLPLACPLGSDEPMP